MEIDFGSIARDHQGQLIAFLVARGTTIEDAEDAVSSAIVRAIETWQVDGVPTNAQAWLLTVSKRLAIDARRRQRPWAMIDATPSDAGPTEFPIASDDPTAIDEAEIPDGRIQLMLACAHPAIDSSVHAPLMLQLVLGLSVERIASLFSLSPPTLAQRLVRAKRKWRANRLPIEFQEEVIPEDRLEAVLRAIYAAFTCGWSSGDAAEQVDHLVVEATRLVEIVVRFQPAHAEALGLLALMLFCNSRQTTRFDHDRFTPLDQQDHRRWNHAMIDRADAMLLRASTHRTIGRYQLEAAIQSVHADRRRTGITQWAAIESLYRKLVELEPVVGAQVGHALSVGNAFGHAQSLAILRSIPAAQASRHQPYWVVLHHAFKGLGDLAQARHALQVAIGLTEDPRVRSYLLQSLGAL
jgi:RNA polymerase sigma-70 factor, ECF subfamily